MSDGKLESPAPILTLDAAGEFAAGATVLAAYWPKDAGDQVLLKSRAAGRRELVIPLNQTVIDRAVAILTEWSELPQRRERKRTLAAPAHPDRSRPFRLLHHDLSPRRVPRVPPAPRVRTSAMLRLLRPRLVVFLLLVFVAASGFGQAPPPPVAGTAGLELMLRRLETTGVVMITNAHPDDENNALIAKLVHGLGLRVVEVTLTRGEGGQNDLGTEHGEALSILRTEELLSAHRLDGAEQMFGRAIDFGYWFSVEETFAKWGKEEMLADLVRLIRMVRPDVIISMSPDGGGGGQHHQTSARLTREAFDAAADRRRFPEQIEETLEPWQATTLYVPIASPPADEAASRPGAESRRAESRRAESRRAESKPDSRPGDVTIDLDVFDSALGCTYAEIGTRARGMHKSQGMARLGALPGPFVSHFRVAAGVIGAGGNAFHIPTSLPQFGRVAQNVRTHAADSTVRLLVAGLREVRRLAKSETNPSVSEGLLATKEAQFLQAIALAAGLRIEALSDAGTRRRARRSRFRCSSRTGSRPASSSRASRSRGSTRPKAAARRGHRAPFLRTGS